LDAGTTLKAACSSISFSKNGEDAGRSSSSLT
jgi:hypothetical protein